jgi:Tfp pilus assembly protein PilF
MYMVARLIVINSLLGLCAAVAVQKDVGKTVVDDLERCSGGSISERIDVCTAIIRLDSMMKMDRISAYLHRGRAYTDKGDYVLAIQDFNDALLLDPKNLQALKGRALAYLDKGDCVAAIHDFDEVLSLSPPDPKGFVLRGTAHACKKDYDQAIEDYTRALQLEQDCSRPWLNVVKPTSTAAGRSWTGVILIGEFWTIARLYN